MITISTLYWAIDIDIHVVYIHYILMYSKWIKFTVNSQDVDLTGRIAALANNKVLALYDLDRVKSVSFRDNAVDKALLESMKHIYWLLCWSLIQSPHACTVPVQIQLSNMVTQVNCRLDIMYKNKKPFWVRIIWFEFNFSRSIIHKTPSPWTPKGLNHTCVVILVVDDDIWRICIAFFSSCSANSYWIYYRC